MNTSYRIVATFVVGVTFCCLSPAAESTVDSMKDGLRFLREGRFSEAIPAFDRCVEGGSDLTVAYANRALCHEALGRTEAAQRDYTRAISKSPKSARLYIMRAWNLISEGAHQKALADLDRAVELEPRNTLGLLVRGICLRKLGYGNRSNQDLRAAVLIDPKCSAELARHEIRMRAVQNHERTLAFLSELSGDNDPDVIREQLERRWFIEVMGSGFWDLDGRFKFYDDLK